MKHIKSFLVRLAIVTVIAAIESNSCAQEIASPLVDSQIKKSNATMELQDAWANTTYAPTHDEKLILQNNSRKEVFLNGDLQTAPSFAEQNGDIGEAPAPQQWQADPVAEVTEQVYAEQVAKKKKKFYRRALNSQYQQNLKDAGVSAPSRDIAQELDQMELINKRQMGN